MKKTFSKILAAPWYVALFAIYPPLALIAYNINELHAQDGLRSLVISLLAASLLFGLLWWILHSRQRAALLVSILLLLFYSYGHVTSLVLKKWDHAALEWILPAAYLLLALAAMLWLARRKTRVRRAAPVLNILALGLTVAAALQVAFISMPRTSTVAADHAEVQALSAPAGAQPPDIYYIIVDSYGRSDLLQRAFQIDNSEFIEELEELGFYVADCSQSNYNRTEVSLASSLNMEYLQNLDDDFHPPNQGRSTLWEAVVHNAVRADLEGAGYNTVAFATGFPWSEIDDADVFLEPSLPWSQLNAFETTLIRTTPLASLALGGEAPLDELEGELYHQRTELIFDSMETLAHMPGPKFVFIHIIPPHPPFIYAADGSWTDPAAFLNDDDLYTAEKYTEGYRNQLTHITSRIIPAMRVLIEESSTEPVIIIQGDHGPWLQRGSGKFMILNAYHLPGHNDLLYPTISPVNTFRLILDTYLGGEYPLLDDMSYYSPTPNIYEFELVENPCLVP